MRIAYLHYLDSSDTALHHVRQFAEATRAVGHDVVVHAMNLAPPEAVDGETRKPSLRLRDAIKRRFRRYLHEPKELLWNLSYIRKEMALLEPAPPDILLVRDHFFTVSCVAVADRLRVPLVLELNAPAAESRLYLDEYRHLPLVAEWLEARKLRRADAILVVSSSLKEFLIRRHHVSSEKIVVNPNGADLARFRPDAPHDATLGEQCTGATVVGFVGSFQKWHGTDLLARMIGEIGRARPKVRFLLVGDGSELASVKRSTAQLGEQVLFTGRLPHDRIPNVVATFDIGVTPDAAFYQSPLKVIEWMAAGRAVVAPAYPPLRDVIDDGVQGLLFEPRNLEALCSAVLRLVDEPALRSKLGAAAAAKARASLSWTDNAHRALGACEFAIRNRRERHAGIPEHP